MYLIDTNICIYAIKTRNDFLLRNIKIKSKSCIYISSLTIAELEFGVSNSNYPDKNRLALMKFVSFFKILGFDEYDAIQYGVIKSKLRKKGTIIGPIDLLLAAQAVSKNLIMVTNNRKEFERITELRIEDWTIEEHN